MSCPNCGYFDEQHRAELDALREQLRGVFEKAGLPPAPWKALHTDGNPDEDIYLIEDAAGDAVLEWTEYTFPVSQPVARAIAAIPEMITSLEQLRAACKTALRWIALNTPMVDNSDPIFGDIKVRADAARAQLRDAIAAAPLGEP